MGATLDLATLVIKQLMDKIAMTVEMFVERVNDYLTEADNHLKKVPRMDIITEKFGVRPCYVPVAALCLLSVFMGYLEEFFAAAVGTAYPAYASFKAIRTP